MAELKPYAAYKDSAVPWLGQVPEHWQLRRPKWLFRKMERPVRDEDQVVTCFRDGVVTLRKNRRVSGFTESLKEIGYQGIRRGDLVIHAMDVFAGAVGVSDSDGKGTPVYSVCQPESNANAQFYAYLVHEMARSQWILALATGIRERSTDFRYSSFASQSVPLPSLPEQVAIVRYLDHADRKVRRAIRARRQLIKLLTEQKQAIIQRAVTRGLDPNVRLKSSGVAWLGDVPEHWEILRLKDACQRIVGGSTPRSDKAEYWNGDVVWVTPIDVTRSQRLDTSLRRITREGLNSCSATLVPAGSIIVTCRAPVGKVAVAATELCTNQGCKAVVLRSEVLTTAFGALLMQTLEPELQSLANGTTFSEIPLHKLACVPIPVPAIDEQITIVHHIEEASASLDKAIDAARREIDLLREYRTRFIADVVTGKLDVRDVTVPADETDAMPEELESIDDVEAIDQTDDVAEGDSESSSEERA